MLYLFQALLVIIILLSNTINIKQKVKIKELSRISLVYIFAKIIFIYFFIRNLYQNIYLYFNIIKAINQ